MGGLVELLGIEGGAESEGDTRAEENIIGNGSNTAVVDLGLNLALAFDPPNRLLNLP